MFFTTDKFWASVAVVAVLMGPQGSVEAGRPKCCCCCKSTSADKGGGDKGAPGKAGDKAAPDGQAKDDDAVMPGIDPLGNGQTPPAMADGPTGDSSKRHDTINQNLKTSGSILAQLLKNDPALRAFLNEAIKAQPAESEVDQFIQKYAPAAEAAPAAPAEHAPKPPTEEAPKPETKPAA